MSPGYAEMTSEQVEAHFKRQGLVILPVGSIEAHGPCLPSGTDGLIAQAFAETLEEKTGALVLPLVAYGYCPTTEGLPATLSVGVEALFAYLKPLLAGLIKKGARRIVVLNIHKENTFSIAPAIQDLAVEQDGFALYINPYYCYAEELDEQIFGEADNSYKEHALLLASLRILGLEIEHRLPKVSQDPIPSRPSKVSRLREVGILRYRYAREEEHIAPRANVSIDHGLLYIERVVQRLTDLLKDYAHYVREEIGG